MTALDHGDGKPVRLPDPFHHLSVVYPFAWAKPNRVHVRDEREGTGDVYSPEYAWALATTIVRAMGGAVLTRREAVLVVEGLVGISSGDAGSYPPAIRDEARSIAERLEAER